MCNCLNWCRDPVIEMKCKPDWVPMSEHHPNCEDYKEEKYVKIGVEGFNGGCYIKFDEVDDFIDDEEGYIIGDEIYLTKDQYEKLPEFQGW